MPAQDISVPCQTAETFMSQWTIDTYRKLPKTAQNRRMEPRIHILKINSDALNYNVSFEMNCILGHFYFNN